MLWLLRTMCLIHVLGKIFCLFGPKKNPEAHMNVVSYSVFNLFIFNSLIIFYSPDLILNPELQIPLTAPHLIPPPSAPSLRVFLHSPPYASTPPQKISLLPGSSSLWRVSYIFSH
jgi:hypothetical protein